MMTTHYEWTGRIHLPLATPHNVHHSVARNQFGSNLPCCPSHQGHCFPVSFEVGTGVLVDSSHPFDRPTESISQSINPSIHHSINHKVRRGTRGLGRQASCSPSLFSIPPFLQARQHAGLHPLIISDLTICQTPELGRDLSHLLNPVPVAVSSLTSVWP